MGLDMYLRASKFVSQRDTVGVIAEPDEGSFAAELNESGTGLTAMEIISVPNPDVGVYDQIAKLVAFDTSSVGDAAPFAEVKFNVGYWRKANHIHKWFVDNVQGGKDECVPHSVSRDQLRTLREACLRVLAAVKAETHGRAVATEHLPTQEGFFFGGSGYDEWYLQDTEETVRIIDRVLAMPKEWYFEYQSSW